ncbi:MAG TPA: alpha/beta hydrolase [Burkholderiaceae bacterium]|nr:alpha/beta hydrolase [Burkholderiaceae bacterium]
MPSLRRSPAGPCRWAALALAACLAQGACAGPLPAMDAEEEVLADGSGPASPFTLPPGARVETDLAYGPDPAQRMDVYHPAATPGGHAPVILFAHGGAWRIGDKRHGSVVAHKMAHWLPRGTLFVSVNYRLQPRADPLEQARDVARALARAQDLAASWGADPARFVLMGHSAGAHLVALLAADPGLGTQQGARPWLGTVALDSAALDVVSIMQARHLRLYDRAFGNQPAFWREVSPLHRLDGARAPLLLVCSSQRRGSCPQAHQLAERATALGGRAQALPVDLSHAEINKTLGQPGRYTEAVDGFLRSLGVP